MSAKATYPRRARRPRTVSTRRARLEQPETYWLVCTSLLAGSLACVATMIAVAL